jgi:hypothetical protein
MSTRAATLPDSIRNVGPREGEGSDSMAARVALVGRTQKILLLVIAVIVILALVLRLIRRGKGPVHLAAESCDATLWSHVYQAQRLQVIEPCAEVEGRVVSLTRESDGDLHIQLDVENRSLLNIYNLLHAHGDLVVELICEGAATRGDAITACAGFTPRVTVPSAGDRVRVTGAYVTDLEHGWNEIHPVTMIEILR